MVFALDSVKQAYGAVFEGPNQSIFCVSLSWIQVLV